MKWYVILHVHFLKYNVVMVNSIILLSQDSESMKSSRWEMLSCQVNIYCENVAIFVILCRHVMKIIWLSRQVEWHLYASIGRPTCRPTIKFIRQNGDWPGVVILLPYTDTGIWYSSAHDHRVLIHTPLIFFLHIIMASRFQCFLMIYNLSSYLFGVVPLI